MKSTRQNNNEFYGNVILGDNILDAHSVTGSLGISGSVTIVKTVRTTDTTNATSWNTGALIVDGGVGIGKDVWISGSLNVLGSTNIINVSSSQLIIEDNIITVNGYSPYLRYAGIEAIDSGSGNTSSLLWDGQTDYWMMISSSNQSSKLIGTTFGTFGSENSLTANYIPKATAANTIANSVIFESSSNIGIGTTTPTHLLHLYKTGVTTQLSITNPSGVDGDTAGILFGTSASTTYAKAGIFFERLTGAAEGTLHFATGNSGGAEVVTKSNARVSISSAGNVGIGVTSPNARLHVRGSTNITGSFTVASGSTGVAILKSFEVASGNYKAGDFWVLGDIYVGPGSSKYFIANNPDGVTTKTDSVKYVAIEGPSKSVFHHGKGFIENKSVEIDLPIEWKWLIDEKSISATISPINKYAKLICEVKNNKLIVYNKSWFKRNIHFSYQLIADRKDVEKLKVYDEFPL